MRSLGEISNYAYSDGVVCQVSLLFILAELERGRSQILVFSCCAGEMQLLVDKGNYID
jgi:hypothetical protein